MVISRFNFTGLKKINRRDIKILLNTSEEIADFNAELMITEYKFPPDSQIFVEAYRQTSWMRFSFGTVSEIRKPVDTQLSIFDSPEDIQFRVRITATGENQGMMLGEADRLRAHGEHDDDDERAPLLRVRQADIGEEIYKVQFEPHPVLLINSATGDWRSVVSSPLFQSLVAPSIFRSILIYILVISDAYDPEDGDSAYSKWLRFANSLPGVSEYDKDDPMNWIDDAVDAFAKLKSVLPEFLKSWGDGNK